MCGSTVYIQSTTAEIRREKRRKIDRRNHRMKIMACPIPYIGGYNNEHPQNIILFYYVERS